VQSGAVRIDGVDVRDVTLHSLRRQIGVVFEESFLFSDTINANIAYGHPDATRDEIEAAARATEADTFVNALPNGYDTVVGERGLTLSGGQRQRIAMARALLTDPRILVLDDATSAVDARIEEEIHATLRRIMRGRTTLLIAHRRSTLRLADRIVVLDRGRVIDDGSHEELLARCPLYRQLLSGPGEGIDELEPVDVELEPLDVADAETEAEAVAVAATTPGPRARVAIDPPLGGGAMGGGGAVAGGGMMGAMGNLPATPELLAALAKLPPANDRPDVDVAAESRNDGQFTLRRFTSPYARPLLIGMVLVAADALMTLAGPYLYRRGIDDGVRHASTDTIWSLGLIFLVVTLADWWTMWAETR
jgi:ATP-binding cassette subfamily B protein